MASASHGEKQFEATPHRREEARKQGRIARSREAGATAAIAALVGTLAAQAQDLVNGARALFAVTLGALDSVTRSGFALPASAFAEGLRMLAPPALAAAAAGTLVGVAQNRFFVNVSLVGFDATRLNPFSRLGEMFSPKQALMQTGISLLRVAAVGAVAYQSARAELPNIMRLTSSSTAAASAQLWAGCGRVAAALLLALAIVAAVEYAASWLRLEKELRMTRQELVDETKQQDGDPKVKGRLRARARALARKRSIKNVKEAAVVVTNPTHISVALRYRADDAAPVVVSKGHDEIALRIRAEARKYGIPILENRPLARALDAEVEVGHPVPSTHFAAVARVLAFVYRLRGRAGTPGA